LTSCSLIIATYNRPDALCLCLKSVCEQSVVPAQVIIADDGSTEETAEVVNEFKRIATIEVKHIWHPDEGFRLAAIRNKAIAEVSSAYVIQIDGDLILHPQFVADHLALKKEGYFVAGSRVMLTKKSTHALLENNSIDLKKYAYPRLDMNGIRNSLLRRFLATRYKAKGKHMFYVKGCNMAFFTTDLLKVNGYNEAFTGWGSEDREIAIRLINAGVKKQFLKNGGICYHLYHPSTSKEKELRNEKMMNDAIFSRSIWAKEGLKKYLHS
jgi:glycosyltransferase involved in cell wall biosynthesis